MSVAFSVDLEPNKDGSLDGVAEVMRWFDDIVPRGTVFATSQIATELPDTVRMLAERHEIGVHVHPREFGHEHDQLAELPATRQRELIQQTRTELLELVSDRQDDVVAFRAGRHSASGETLDVLSDLEFEIDASIHVRYGKYLPEVRNSSSPFRIDCELVEVPTTYSRPSLFSRVGFSSFPQRTVTATAATLRTDDRWASGIEKMRLIFDRNEFVSMYMHPYDAHEYHRDLSRNGPQFRTRIEGFLQFRSDEFVTMTDVKESFNEDN